MVSCLFLRSPRRRHRLLLHLLLGRQLQQADQQQPLRRLQQRVLLEPGRLHEVRPLRHRPTGGLRHGRTAPELNLKRPQKSRSIDPVSIARMYGTSKSSLNVVIVRQVLVLLVLVVCAAVVVGALGVDSALEDGLLDGLTVAQAVVGMLRALVAQLVPEGVLAPYSSRRPRSESKLSSKLACSMLPWGTCGKGGGEPRSTHVGQGQLLLSRFHFGEWRGCLTAPISRADP